MVHFDPSPTIRYLLMTILSLGKISSHPSNNGTKTAEVSFDGRTFAVVSMDEQGSTKLETLDSASPEDLAQATLLAKTNANASLSFYVFELFQVEMARDSKLRRMRKKLKKNTLFSDPSTGVQAIAKPYCERIRLYITQNHPDAVILNTLSEDEAFRHYASL